MLRHDVFFWGTSLFLLGIFLGSLGFKSEIFFLTAFIFCACVLSLIIHRKKQFLIMALLSLFMIFGTVFYAFVSNQNQKNTNLIYEEVVSFSGIVSTNPKSGSYQEFKLISDPPFRGALLVRAPSFPKLEYDDRVKITGKITKTDKGYYKKEKINGIVSFPQKISVTKPPDPSLKNLLFKFRNRVIAAYKSDLPLEESSLISGLTLGSQEEFSENLKAAMKKSGTLHLVALSGSNIAVIFVIIFALAVHFINKRIAFFLSVPVIVFFVLMTGSESSAVRAAIMSIVSMAAPFFGRIYRPKNAIVFSALLMTLENPNILAFDIGFQLSFLAVTGISYLQPIIQKKIPTHNNFLNWKENISGTLAAQVAVAPLLFLYFKNFSLLGIISNLILLPLIPYTMLLGFLTAGTHILFSPATPIVSIPLAAFLKFELGIIRLIGT